MSVHLTSAVSLIDQPLEAFLSTESNQSLKITIPDAGGSTASWASKMLMGTRLNKKTWSWKEDDEYVIYRRKLGVTGKIRACIPPPIVDRPENEADLITALDMQLLSVVHRVTEGWPPHPTTSSATTGQKWTTVIISEAYSKASLGQSETSVRVDKLVSLKARWDGKRMQTRSLAASREHVHDANVNSMHNYLPRDAIWGIHEKASDLGHKKGLVAVEVKKLGLLKPDDMQKIANRGENLGLSRTTAPIGAGTRGILQQAIRYAYHYGTEYAYITDYQTGILLRVPDLDDAVGKEENGSTVVRELVEVDWAVVDVKQARNALAFLVSCACRKMEATIKTKGS